MQDLVLPSFNKAFIRTDLFPFFRRTGAVLSGRYSVLLERAVINMPNLGSPSTPFLEDVELSSLNASAFDTAMVLWSIETLVDAVFCTPLCSKGWWLERHPSIEQHLLLLVVLWELDKQQKQTRNSLALSHPFSTSTALNSLHWHRPRSFLQSLHFSRTFFFFNVTWVTANVLPVERSLPSVVPSLWQSLMQPSSFQLRYAFTKACRFLTLSSNRLSLNQSWYLTINCSFSFWRSDTYNEPESNSPPCPASHSLTNSVSSNSAKRSRSLAFLHVLHESFPVLPASLWALVFVFHIFVLILQWLHCMQQENNRDSERFAVPLPLDSYTTAAVFARMAPSCVSLVSGGGLHTMLQMNVCLPWISVLAVLLDLWRDLRHHLGLNVSVMLQHWPISMLPLVDRSHNQQ